MVEVIKLDGKMGGDIILKPLKLVIMIKSRVC